MIFGYLLPKDKSFEFKYLIDGTYINHPEADSYSYMNLMVNKIVC